ncbi:low molecular weight phosphatase family protein [Phycicoccus sonneratiae]|uniref:protein-tyrosine-phosphatase n=1 Tax=Phycicoccus sonneratiae TaxID=2807628 RepID=A0ABS2CMJ4_9MICO|nr:low molecular weight phosphatase family protein [Phycicoccus sonneraticus]MBM6401102.1 low molecular weight phosphatase family protein [Phycicoccus sonneraticus]
MNGPGHVLVVCTGNVCRSPYLERRLRQDLAGTGIEVSSAGTRGLVGRDMDPTSRALLVRAGADAEGFAARELTSELVAGADLVITAAREHRAAAARLHPAALRRAMTLRDLADLLDGVTPRELADGYHGESTWVRHVVDVAASRRGLVPARQDGVDVTDPIGRGPEVFDRMAAEIDGALVPVVAALRAAPSA